MIDIEKSLTASTLHGCDPARRLIAFDRPSRAILAANGRPPLLYSRVQSDLNVVA